MLFVAGIYLGVIGLSICDRNMRCLTLFPRFSGGGISMSGVTLILCDVKALLVVFKTVDVKRGTALVGS